MKAMTLEKFKKLPAGRQLVFACSIMGITIEGYLNRTKGDPAYPFRLYEEAVAYLQEGNGEYIVAGQI